MFAVHQCVQHTVGNIDELKRKQDLESLRPFVVKEKCFPMNMQERKQPIPIGLEELKKLARAWKLNERRNFWKNHDTRDKLVIALCDFVDEQQRLRASASVQPNESGSAVGSFSRRDHMGSTDSLADMSISTTQSTFLPREPSLSKPSKATPEMRNYCGLVKLFKYPTAEELITKTRHNEAPKPSLQPESLVNDWRGEDFSRAEAGAAAEGAAAEGATAEGAAAAPEMSAGDTIRKHRSLTQHLYQFSLSADLKTRPMTIGVLQTFVDLADTSDFLSALNILVSASNLLQFHSVRSLLIEVNGFHKISALVPLTMPHVHSALQASALMYYYYSCDGGIEDRVFNEAYPALSVNFESEFEEIQMITLFTLNNLLPSISRHRIADLVMKIVAAHLLTPSPELCCETEGQQEETLFLLLRVLSNASIFANVHPMMFRSRATNALLRLTAYACRANAPKIALHVAMILNNFLSPTEASRLHVTDAVAGDFVEVAKGLLAVQSNDVLAYALRSLVVMSAAPDFARLIATVEVVSLVTRIVLHTDISKFGPVIAGDFAHFFYNLTCVVTLKILDGEAAGDPADSSEVVGAVVSCGAHECCLKLVDAHSGDSASTPTTKFAMMALQNLLSWNFPRYYEVASCVMEPLLEVIRTMQSIAAIRCVFNICCRSREDGGSKIELLAQNMIHVKFLDFFSRSTGDLEASSAYLQVLVQMCSDRVVAELFERGLLQALVGRVKPLVSTSMRRESFVSNSANAESSIVRLVQSSSTLVLAVASNYSSAGNSLQPQEMRSILRVLHIVVTSRIDNLLVNQLCACALAFLSSRHLEYEDARAVVLALMRVCRRDESLMESLSLFLHNVCCDRSNVEAVLRDDAVLNFLIKLLRSGSVRVQMVVLETFRTLCSYESCVGLMTRGSILSDLIVVGILRSSSAEVKDVCSEAFYNILTHDAYRRQLLQGEFWWGFSRLCREPNDSIRAISSRGLFDLSCTRDDAILQSLRSHNIFGLALDLVSSASISTECMERVLFAVNNFLSHFNSEPYYLPQETTAVSKIALEVLAKHPEGTALHTHVLSPASVAAPPPSTAGIACAVAVLASVAQRAPPGCTDCTTECTNYDVADLLAAAIPRWQTDAASRLNVSVLLVSLSQSAAYMKAVAIADFAAVLLASYSALPSAPVAENVCTFFLNYLRLESADAALLLSLPVFFHVMCDCLGVSRECVQLCDYKHCPPEQELVVSGAVLLEELFLSVMCLCLEPLSQLLNSYDSTGFVAGFFKSAALINNPGSRRALLQIIQHFSTMPRLSQQMLSSDLFTLLLAVQRSGRQASREAGVAAAKFNSLILMNLSLLDDTQVMRAILRGNENFPANAVDVISAALADSSGGDAVGGQVAVVFHKAAAATEHGLSLTPQYMLDMISQMNSGMIDHRSNLYINKATVGAILERHGDGVKVDPAFVQAVFAEMKNPLIAAVPAAIAQMAPTSLGREHRDLPFSLLNAPPSTVVSLASRARAADMWAPCVAQEKKPMSAASVSHSLSSVACETAAAPSEAYPSQPFEKVARVHALVQIDFAEARAVAAAMGGAEPESRADPDAA